MVRNKTVKTQKQEHTEAEEEKKSWSFYAPHIPRWSLCSHPNSADGSGPETLQQE